MSALGHKQTCAPQKAMSALPPIATKKADMRAAKEALLFNLGQMISTRPCLNSASDRIANFAISILGGDDATRGGSVEALRHT
jgi:hypothetical protein